MIDFELSEHDKKVLAEVRRHTEHDRERFLATTRI